MSSDNPQTSLPTNPQRISPGSSSAVFRRTSPRPVIVGRSDRNQIQSVTPPLRPRDPVAAEVEGVRGAWNAYQSTRDRDAVYDYLSAVFALINRWLRDRRLKKNLYRTLDLLGSLPRMRIGEAYALVIYCTCDLAKVDAKTRSKWSRVLRYAATFNRKREPVKAFIKRRGGINACASRFARRLGRAGQ